MPYLVGHSIYSHCQVLENLCHEQLRPTGTRDDGETLGIFSISVNLNSKMKVSGVGGLGGGADHAEWQLGAEKGQGVIFGALAGADHPGVTKGREEEG